MMDEIRRLAIIGFPIDDAVMLCSSMQKEGILEDFIQAQEEEYRRRCAEFVEEVLD